MTDSRSVLLQLLPAIGETVTVFRQLLETEAQLLADNDFEQLPQVISDKLDMAEKLDMLERERQQAMTQLGCADAGFDSMQQLLGDTEAAGLLADWQQTLGELEQCMQLNSQSGATISLQSQYTQRALDVLAGGLDQSMTYGPEGKKGITPRSHPLGKA